jgi:hypothetical protein
MLERFHELVAPEYDKIVQGLIKVALDGPDLKTKDPAAVQQRAREYILDRLLGKAPEYLDGPAAPTGASAGSLLDHWKEDDSGQ